MTGLVYLCGPSGAGKDALYAFARERLEGAPGLAFALRYMTRPAGPASVHRAVSGEEFDALAAAGGFCMTWSAHGHRYGIERRAADLVAEGNWVVVSGSREQVPRARTLFPGTKVVRVTAPPELLVERLWRRGRDSAADIAEREARNRLWSDLHADLEIVNAGELRRAGEALVSAVSAWLSSEAHR